MSFARVNLYFLAFLRDCKILSILNLNLYSLHILLKLYTIQSINILSYASASDIIDPSFTIELLYAMHLSLCSLSISRLFKFFIVISISL